MKKLAVMRHAEAGMAFVDKKRKLTSHGMQQAFESAVKLKEVFLPQLVLVSPAVRTRMTAEQVASVYGWGEGFCQFEDSIYDSSTKNLLNLIEKLPDEYQDVLLIGHNPGVSNLVSELTKGMGVYYSPATFALLKAEISSWYEVSSEACSVEISYSPF